MFSLKKYIPDAFAWNVFRVDYSQLRKNGIKVLCFDVDRTLKQFNDKKLSEEIIALIGRLKNDFTVIIMPNTLSRSRSKIMEEIFRPLDVEIICLERGRIKPNPDGLFEVMERTGCTKDEMVYIGDDICRDVVFAKNAGVYSVFLFKPLGPHPLFQLIFLRHRCIDVLVRRKFRHLYRDLIRKVKT